MLTRRHVCLGLIFVGLVAAPYRAAAAESREGYVDVEGGRVWYRIVGSGPRTPLLLLHGGPGFPSYYLDTLEALADERPVIFYDQLGCGRSDRPTDESLWRTERFVTELAQIRAALDLKEVHILGHSWGTMLGVDYMLTKPDGVRSLVLASPCLSASRWTSDARVLIKTLPEPLQATIEKHERDGTYDSPEYQEAVTEYYRRFVCRRDPWPEEFTKAIDGANMAIYGMMWGPSEFTATGTLQTYERADRLGELNLPVLFTVGRFDEATPDTVEHFRSLVPGARLEIVEDSAHLTMLDQPEAYVRAVREFLHSVEQP